MDANGANQQQLTTNSAGDSDAIFALLPGDEKIFFASSRDGDWEIFIMDVNSANQQQLTSNTSTDDHPSW